MWVGVRFTLCRRGNRFTGKFTLDGRCAVVMSTLETQDESHFKVRTLKIWQCRKIPLTSVAECDVFLPERMLRVRHTYSFPSALQYSFGKGTCFVRGNLFGDSQGTARRLGWSSWSQKAACCSGRRRWGIFAWGRLRCGLFGIACRVIVVGIARWCSGQRFRPPRRRGMLSRLWRPMRNSMES